MATKNIKSKTGFTIIEVVLVLAVAGLIFLMVFIALPALQRSQRDTQRRQAVSTLSAAVTQFQTNNTTKNDNLPGTGDSGANTVNQVVATCYFAPENFEYKDMQNTVPEAATSFMDAPRALLATNGPVLIAADPEGGSSSSAAAAGNNSACKFIKQYLNPANATETTFLDPDGVAYSLQIQTIGEGGATQSLDTFDHMMHIYRRAKCNGETAVPAETRQYAVMYKLEGGGTVCLDNS